MPSLSSLVARCQTRTSRARPWLRNSTAASTSSPSSSLSSIPLRLVGYGKAPTASHPRQAKPTSKPWLRNSTTVSTSSSSSLSSIPLHLVGYGKAPIASHPRQVKPTSSPRFQLSHYREVSQATVDFSACFDASSAIIDRQLARKSRPCPWRASATAVSAKPTARVVKSPAVPAKSNVASRPARRPTSPASWVHSQPQPSEMVSPSCSPSLCHSEWSEAATDNLAYLEGSFYIPAIRPPPEFDQETMDLIDNVLNFDKRQYEEVDEAFKRVEDQLRVANHELLLSRLELSSKTPRTPRRPHPSSSLASAPPAAPKAVRFLSAELLPDRPLPMKRIPRALRRGILKKPGDFKWPEHGVKKVRWIRHVKVARVPNWIGVLDPIGDHVDPDPARIIGTMRRWPTDEDTPNDCDIGHLHLFGSGPVTHIGCLNPGCNRQGDFFFKRRPLLWDL